MKTDLLNWEKSKIGELELSEFVFAQPLRRDVLHQVVRWHLACGRSGTHRAKNKAEVSGGGKKPFRQKGTGNARQGSSRSPLNESGGVVFPPRPRNYAYKINKKIKNLALRVAVSYLRAEGRLFVLEELSSTQGRTAELQKRLQKWNLTKAYLVDLERNELMWRASRNLKSVCYEPLTAVNVYKLLKHDNLFLSRRALDGLQKAFGAAS